MTSVKRKAEKNLSSSRIKIDFAPKTENQKKYVESINNNLVTICTGPAGVGKTSIPVALACKSLIENKVDRIVITRPAVEASKRGMGFLPGDITSKFQIYLVPILDEMEKYLGSFMVEELLKTEKVKMYPIEYLRGTNHHASFIIGDEFQNANVHQIKLVLTRLGQNSVCVISGDPTQSDLEDSGLEFVKSKLEGLEGVGIVELGVEDIVRNDLIGKILRRLES